MSVNIIRLVVSIAICEGAGVLGSLFTTPSVPTWLASLNKPSFNPPNWIFGPVWTFLFFLMGVALYIVWSRGLATRGVKTALLIFGIQLFLNILWSVLFFGLHLPFAAFIEIIFLWLAILASIVTFYRVSATASLLLIPYILWVSFASVLNFYLWRLNI